MPEVRPCLAYALFMPCLCLLYGFYVPCMCLGYASSHVMPTLACAMAGIYGCGIHGHARLNIKTRHCILGWGRVKQPCHADAGRCDGGYLWLRHIMVIHLIIKTRHCISGYGGVVPSGLGLAHCHRLRPADGGGCHLPRCQCPLSFLLKSYFFLLIFQVFVFLPSSIA